MKNILTLALFISTITAKAQVTEIVSSGGGAYSSSSLSLEFTVGDIAVGSYEQGSLRWFEGFQSVNYGISLITGLSTETTFSFYPNPTQKFLTIESDFAPGSTFHVTDITGKDFVLQTELTAHRAIVDVSSLPNALYVLTIQDKNGPSYRVKFIKAL